MWGQGYEDCRGSGVSACSENLIWYLPPKKDSRLKKILFYWVIAMTTVWICCWEVYNTECVTYLLDNDRILMCECVNLNTISL